MLVVVCISRLGVILSLVLVLGRKWVVVDEVFCGVMMLLIMLVLVMLCFECIRWLLKILFRCMLFRVVL